MSLSEYKAPFVVSELDTTRQEHCIRSATGRRLCQGLTDDEAEELCSILNAHFATKEEKVEDPKPDIDQTNKVAAAWWASGRKLPVQYFYRGKWNTCGENDIGTTDGLPAFHIEDLAFRIAPPATERIVVDVFRSEGLDCFHDSHHKRGSDGHKALSNDSRFRIVGTLQGEVEV